MGCSRFFRIWRISEYFCTSVNDQVVHGIPSDYILKDGDIVSVDCGVILNGFYGDTAYSYSVGNVSQEVAKLLKTTKEVFILVLKKQ
jgi:methionyl aminopeptidase